MSTASTTPIWATQALPQRLRAGPLPACRVCVIGAGVAGLSVALELLEAGYPVTVIERDHVGAGETMRSTAHLASGLDDRFHVLEREHGTDGARHAATSHRAAIDLIEGWVDAHHIECGFRRVDGFLFAAAGCDPAILDREYEACMRAGLEVQRVRRIEGLPAAGPALRFARQARIDPLRYVEGLAAAVRRRGGRIARGEACGIEDGTPCRVVLRDQRELRCDAVVVCTNVPFHRVLAYHTKQAAYRTFVLAFDAAEVALREALYWDTADPYHYVRWQDDPATTPVLLVGGADHKTGQGDAEQSPFGVLEAWARAFHPGLGRVLSAWSGQVIEPVDGLGFIGRDAGSDRVFVVTGDSGNGITHATLAAPLIAALVADRPHPWQALYASDRRHLNREWLHENANVVKQYADWIGPSDPIAPDELVPGSGGVVRVGLHRYAVCRDGDGHLHAFSARCPHLGGSVRWNADETSWDCPCHGSRFSAFDGAVLNGPAVIGLEPVPIDAVRQGGADVAAEVIVPHAPDAAARPLHLKTRNLQ